MKQAWFVIQLTAAVGAIRKIAINGHVTPANLKPVIDPLIAAWDAAFPKEAIDPALVATLWGIVDSFLEPSAE